MLVLYMGAVSVLVHTCCALYQVHRLRGRLDIKPLLSSLAFDKLIGETASKEAAGMLDQCCPLLLSQPAHDDLQCLCNEIACGFWKDLLTMYCTVEVC